MPDFQFMPLYTNFPLVIPSAAKDLYVQPVRPFAALGMTTHYRFRVEKKQMKVPTECTTSGSERGRHLFAQVTRAGAQTVPGSEKKPTS